MHLRLPGSAFARVAVALLVLTFISTSTAFAQNKPSPEQLRQSGLIKMVVGGGAMTLGAVMLAASHSSATVNTGFGTISGSATNKGAMVVGAAALAGGGYLVYLGSKDRKAANSPSIGFTVGKTKSVYFQKTW